MFSVQGTLPQQDEGARITHGVIVKRGMGGGERVKLSLQWENQIMKKKSTCVLWV